MNTDNGWTRKKALLHNLKASFKAYKDNCRWYINPKSQWYMKDSKYSNFSAKQFAENNKQYYSEQTFEKDITLNDVYNICFDYFNLQEKGA